MRAVELLCAWKKFCLSGVRMVIIGRDGFDLWPMYPTMLTPGWLNQLLICTAHTRRREGDPGAAKKRANPTSTTNKAAISRPIHHNRKPPRINLSV